MKTLDPRYRPTYGGTLLDTEVSEEVQFGPSAGKLYYQLALASASGTATFTVKASPDGPTKTIAKTGATEFADIFDPPPYSLTITATGTTVDFGLNVTR